MQNPEWAQVDRNTIGSPQVAALRGGPYVRLRCSLRSVWAPWAMTIQPTGGANDAEQASFGNEVDFVGDDVSARHSDRLPGVHHDW